MAKVLLLLNRQQGIRLFVARRNRRLLFSANDSTSVRSMSESEFIQKYVSSFLGAYAAQNYDRNCQEGWIMANQPVEDAYELAREAWARIAGM